MTKRTCVPAIFFLILGILLTNVHAAEINVPGDYAAIQDAIDASESGDTILVQPGTYVESLLIDKPLNVECLTEYDHVTRCYIRPPASSSGPTVSIVSSSSAFTGFTVTTEFGVPAAETGISVSGSSDVTLYGNEIRNNGTGLSITDSSDCRIYFNNITDNTVNVVIGNSVCSWNSPAPMDYTYMSVDFTGHLGNKWRELQGGGEEECSEGCLLELDICTADCAGDLQCELMCEEDYDFCIEDCGSGEGEGEGEGEGGSNGFDQCMDDDIDGVCDEPWIIDAFNTDLYPLADAIESYISEGPPPGPTTWYVSKTGQDDFMTISEAVTAAGDDDTIIVRDGLYQENIIVTSSVSILSESGRQNTSIIAEDDQAPVISVTVGQGVTVSGFEISGSAVSAGIRLGAGSSHTISNNHIHHNFRGILLRGICTGSGCEYSENHTIMGNLIEDNAINIYFENTAGNTVSDNDLTGDMGIFFRLESENLDNLIEDNRFQVLETTPGFDNYGVQYMYGEGNRILNNTFTGFDTSVVGGSGLLVSGNTIRNSTKNGVFVSDATVSDNTLLNNETGIYAGHSAIVTGNTLENNNYGIRINRFTLDPTQNTVVNNDITAGTYGIHSDGSGDTITDNRVSQYAHGIYLDGADDCTIESNTLSDNEHGVYFASASSSTVSGNTVSGSSWGAYFYSAPLNTLSNNTFTGCGLYIEQTYDLDVSGNTVNLKPLVYLVNDSGSVVEDAGQVVALNSSNITVRNMDATATAGVIFDGMDGGTIEGNSFSGNQYGVLIRDASLVTIRDNDFTDNVNGLYFESVTGSSVSENEFVDHTVPLSLLLSDGNEFTRNELAEYSSIYFTTSNDNVLFLNSFRHEKDFYTDTTVHEQESANIWHSPYKLVYEYNGNVFMNYLGNFWAVCSLSEFPDDDGDGIDDEVCAVEFFRQPPLFDPFTLHEGHEAYSIQQAGLLLGDLKADEVHEAGVTDETFALTSPVSGDEEGEMEMALVVSVLDESDFAGSGYVTGTYTLSLESEERTGVVRGHAVRCDVPPPPEGEACPCNPGDILVDGSLSGDMTGVLSIALNEDEMTARGSARYLIDGEGPPQSIALDGTLTLEGTAMSLVEINVYQRSMSGYVAEFEEFLSGMVTAVTFQDRNEGFADIGYTSSYGGSGNVSGYTYHNSGQAYIEGPSEGALPGLAVISMDQESLSGEISIIRLEDMDVPNLYADVVSQYLVSPGQTVQYVVNYGNTGTGVAENVHVALAMDFEAVEFLYASRGGEYYYFKDKVVWEIGSLSPGEHGNLVAHILWRPGLADEVTYRYTPLIGTTTTPAEGVTLSVDTFMNELEVTGTRIVPSADAQNELDNVLLDDPGLQDLLDYAASLGFTEPGVIVHIDFDNGRTFSEIPMKDPATDEVVTINKYRERWIIKRLVGTAYQYFDENGGIALNPDDPSDVTSWGEWSTLQDEPSAQAVAKRSPAGGGGSLLGCQYSDVAKCIADRMIENLPNELAKKGLEYGVEAASGGLKTMYDIVQGAANTFSCLDGDEYSCAETLAGALDEFPGVSDAITIAKWITGCLDETEPPCTPGDEMRTCVLVKETLGWGVQHWDCKEEAGLFTSECFWEEWGIPILCDTCSGNGHDCIADCNNGRCFCPRNSRCNENKTNAAHDPNAKYGKDRRVLPDEIMDYKVEFENIGDGIAFGVYVTDVLDENLDETTLVMDSQYDWDYDANTRTITWYIGRVDGHSGGEMNFTISPVQGLEDGTHIINSAIIYFPSVPEVTPTNPVVSVIDTLPPEIDVRDIIEASDSATIRWAYNEPASYEICFGPSPADYSECTGEGDFLVRREARLTDLDPEETYGFRISSCDPLGHCAQYESLFTTLSKPDSDGDGVPDDEEACPEDPDKTEPGACGCGTPDTDSDEDGTADCIDDCPGDMDKIEPGICGCGTPDTDSDGDGTADCNDACPADPNKIDPGICGCGTPDTDSDSDTVPDCNDNCPNTPNPDQSDTDDDGTGDDCEEPVYMQCDIDHDHDVDIADIRVMLFFRNQPAGACQECDIDGDGTITVLDVRRCVIRCTLPRCVEP